MPPTHLHHPSTCTDEWRPTASPLSGLPRKKAQEVYKSQLRSKRSSNGPSPENFLAISGYFERNTYRVMALRWLKKERKKKISDDFQPFQVGHLKTLVSIH